MEYKLFVKIEVPGQMWTEIGWAHQCGSFVLQALHILLYEISNVRTEEGLK
jgi:hypothetical protein